MTNLHIRTALILVMSVILLASCDEDDEARLPSIRPVTKAEFTRCTDGKIWKHVDSYEIKGNGTMSKNSYWEDLIGGGPVQYGFNGGTVTTYLYIDAYPFSGYRTEDYTYNEATNQVMTGQYDLFTVVDVNDNELRLIKHQASTGDGKAIYVYSIYRAMTPGEASALKDSYPYNLGTLNEDYPEMPEQQRITAEDFNTKVAGQAWHCAEAHGIPLAGRYDKGDYFAGKTKLTPIDYEITADSIYEISADKATGTAVRKAYAYTYRANGFYVETAGETIFRIISLTEKEMRIVQQRHEPATGYRVDLYCIYISL